jgi:hypothetical protein
VAPIGAIPLQSGQAIARWFNIDAFDRKALDQLGSNLVTLPTRFSGVRAPAVDVWNMSGIKRFSMPDKMKLEFHADFLNALNHTNLAAPNTNPINAAFGSITSTPGNQRSILFGLKLVY